VGGEGISEAAGATALSRIETLCRYLHDGQSCFLLGIAYETGRVYPRDPARARQLYEDACRARVPATGPVN
jgi:TPR repeat protein